MTEHRIVPYLRQPLQHRIIHAAMTHYKTHGAMLPKGVLYLALVANVDWFLVLSGIACDASR